MASKIDTIKVDKAFKKTEQFKYMAKVGMAAFEYHSTGGFREIVNAPPSSWRKLDADSLRQKRKLGQPARPWVATGKTLETLSSGPITKVGTSKGLNFIINTKGMATLTTTKMKKRIKRKKGGKTTLWGLLNHGYERPIEWREGDFDRVLPFVERAVAEIMRESGFKAKKGSG